MSRRVKLICSILLALVLSSLIGLELFGSLISDKLNEALSEEDQSTILRVIYPNDFPELSPYSFNYINRSIISNLYEPLVRFDPYLQIESSLAKSWGLLDDQLTWDFILRDNVYFTNGNQFTSDDVLTVYNLIKRSRNSYIKAFLTTIQRIEIVDDFKIRFVLKEPDPFFLSKLTTMLIFQDLDEGGTAGTGPYYQPDLQEDEITLSRNHNYWGTEPSFETIVFAVEKNPEARVRALESNKVDIVVHLPNTYPDSLLSEYKIQVFNYPALETYFLGFDTDASVFQNIEMRQAVAWSLDMVQIEALGGGTLKGANQFVSSGVFGFNPQIEYRQPDMEHALQLFQKIEPFKRVEVTLDLVPTLNSLGDYIKNQLYKLGFDVNLNYLPSAELLSKIASGESDFYILGFKHELGDVNDFFLNMVDSSGKYNTGMYLDENVDDWIDRVQTLDDDLERQTLMQKIMYYITEINPFGVPLFNSEIVYGAAASIKFQPRFDGYILGREIGLDN